MKKKLFSMLMLTTLFALPVFVNAEEVKQPSDFNDTKDVVVGNIDTTVYSVDVHWSGFSYDWKYDKETNKFGFKSSIGCEGYKVTSDTFQDWIDAGEKVYLDNQCTSLQTGDFVAENTYYRKTNVNGYVSVADNSVNGRIKAKVGFTPSNSYDWVSGKFYQGYIFTPSTESIEYGNELVNNYLSLVSNFSGSSRLLHGILKLEVNDKYNGSETIETGATIGTVTLEISEDND